MITHCILLSSAYSIGKRIALDYIIENSNDEAKKALERIMKECGKGISISTHMIQSKDNTWKSVVEVDAYFKNVRLIKRLDEFISLIQRDRSLVGLDVAKYISTQIPCTHLKIEKLTYLAFADYLCLTGKRLFRDYIFAFKYGPVVDTVYEACKKKYGYVNFEKEKNEILGENISIMPAKSRILCAEDGLEKLRSIDETIKKYGKFDARELVEITHRDQSPWRQTGYVPLTKKLITEDTIKEFHRYESVI